MSLTGKKTVFAVDSNDRVRACVVYVKNDKGIFGAYYGYSGGAHTMTVTSLFQKKKK